MKQDIENYTITIMNDDTVHLPMDDGDGKALPHYNQDGSRVDDPYKDISGNLALQEVE